MVRIVRCPGTLYGSPCRETLAVDRDGRWDIRHRGRRWLLRPGVEIADAVEAVHCDACRTATPGDRLDVREYLPEPPARVA